MKTPDELGFAATSLRYALATVLFALTLTRPLRPGLFAVCLHKLLAAVKGHVSRITRMQKWTLSRYMRSVKLLLTKFYPRLTIYRRLLSRIDTWK
jgi:hypothetical protein